MTHKGASNRIDVPNRRLRRTVKAVGRRMGWLTPDTHTELVISVTCAARALAGWTPSAGATLTDHHMTLLDPFVPSFALDAGVFEGIREVLMDFEPFDYQLVGVERFPDVLYLAPEPAEPFVAMTEALWRRFPEYPPYGGAFADIVPHVTLSLGREPAGLAEHVLERLPVRDRVEDVELRMEDTAGEWGIAERFALGRRVRAVGRT